MVEGKEDRTSKMESRWVAFLTAVALTFGGIWLQNQYDATLRLQEQMAAFMRHVDDKYVQKDYMETIASRLSRMEDKLDDLHAAQIRNEKVQYPYSNGGGPRE